MLTKPTLKGIPLVTYEMVYDFMHLIVMIINCVVLGIVFYKII